MIASLVLKNPIYSDVHGLIRHHLKPTIKKIQKTIYAIRTKFKPLEETLMINPYNIGYNILKIKREEEEKEKKKTEIQTKQMLQMQGYTEVILEKEENNDGERMDTAGSNLETNDKFDSKIDGRGTMIDG